MNIHMDCPFTVFLIEHSKEFIIYTTFIYYIFNSISIPMFRIYLLFLGENLIIFNATLLQNLNLKQLISCCMEEFLFVENLY